MSMRETEASTVHEEYEKIFKNKCRGSGGNEFWELACVH